MLTFNCSANIDVVMCMYSCLHLPCAYGGDVVTSEVTRTLNPFQVVSITVTAELKKGEKTPSSYSDSPSSPLTIHSESSCGSMCVT